MTRQATPHSAASACSTNRQPAAEAELQTIRAYGLGHRRAHDQILTAMRPSVTRVALRFRW